MKILVIAAALALGTLLGTPGTAECQWNCSYAPCFGPCASVPGGGQGCICMSSGPRGGRCITFERALELEAEGWTRLE